MALVCVALLIGLAIGVGSGGSVHRLATMRIRRWPLLAAGAVLFVLPHSTAIALGTATLAAFAASNLRNTGMGVVAIGLSLNAFVVLVNGGMPVRGEALAAIGHADMETVADEDLGARRHVADGGDTLTGLGDVIPIPPLGAVVSFGDLIIAVGLADVVAHLTRRRKAEAAQRATVPAIDPELFSDENLTALAKGAAVHRADWHAAAHDSGEFDFNGGQSGSLFDEVPVPLPEPEPVRRAPSHRRSDSLILKGDGPITPPWGVIKLPTMRRQRPTKPQMKSPARHPKVAMDIDEPWDSETLARLASDDFFRAAS